MTELTNKPNNSYLSASSLNYSHLSASSLSTRSSPINPKEDWNLKDLEAKMRKGVRKEVSASSMKEELAAFYKTQKIQSFIKIIITFVATCIMYSITSIDTSVLFTFVLFIASSIFCTSILPFTDSNLIGNVRKIQPIIYCSIFYSLLKWATGINKSRVDWPSTYFAIIATFTHATISFYKPFLQLAARQILSQAIQEQNPLSRLLIFKRYLVEKTKHTIRITRHLIIVVGIISSLILLLLFVFNKFTIELFHPSFIVISLPLFVVLEGYYAFIDFINEAFSLNRNLGKTIKNKIPVFLNLLRLEAKPLNRMVQIDCLKYIYVKISKADNFLSTETCNSLLYGTYMEIFSQFASAQLQKSDKTMQQFLSKTKVNDKTTSLQKGLLQDLLIYYKKLAATVLSEWQVSKMLQILTNLTYLFFIIEEIESDKKLGDTRILIRVINLTKSIKKTISESSERISLSKYTRGELINVYQSLINQQTSEI